MPGRAHPAPGDGTVREGLRLAVTTFTIAPVRVATVNRATAAVAMTAAPAIGAVLGGLVGGLAIAGREAHAPALLTGFVCAGAAAALTRGLHLDGLADTADALGSYRDADRALEIMKSPEIGPFGVVAIVLAIAIPATAIAALLDRPWWAVLSAVAAAFAAGRLAAGYACRHDIPAARPNGLGATVAGTVGVPTLVVATVLTAALAAAAEPDRWWQGPLAVLAGLGAAGVLVAHAVRRLGGITGDVLGAAVEIGAGITFIGLAIGS
jgi:adenosylcobinamide-GDP ribazoletransferase